MWLSKNMTEKGVATPGTQPGIVTISGQQPGVLLSGEARRVNVLSLGGVYWSPRVGDEVVTLCAEDGGRYLLALPGKAPVELKPGEVYIKTQSAAIYMKNDGGIEISGDASFGGQLSVDGDIVVAGGLTASGGIRVRGDAEITGSLIVGGLDIMELLGVIGGEDGA